MFQPNAIYLLIAFTVIYAATHLAVSKLPQFAHYSQIKRSLVTKLIAVTLFAGVALAFSH